MWQVKPLSEEDYEKLNNTPRGEGCSVKMFGYEIKTYSAYHLLSFLNNFFGCTKFLFNTNSAKPVIIDCGANIGISTLYFKWLYPDSKVIAFEADPTIAEYLEFNIKSSGYENVEIIKRPLWSSEGKVSFHSEGTDSGRVLASECANSKELSIEVLDTVLLSKYMHFDKIDFLKMDIEGAEVGVLLEARDYLHKIENMFIEYHSMPKDAPNLSVLLGLLEQNGFKYIIDRPPYFAPEQPFMKANTYLEFDLQLDIYAYKHQNYYKVR